MGTPPLCDLHGAGLRASYRSRCFAYADDELGEGGGDRRHGFGTLLRSQGCRENFLNCARNVVLLKMKRVFSGNLGEVLSKFRTKSSAVASGWRRILCLPRCAC